MQAAPGSITLDVYSKTWWEERVDTVTRVVEAVMTEPEEKEEETNVATPSKALTQRRSWRFNGNPFGNPRVLNPTLTQWIVVEKIGRGERI